MEIRIKHDFDVTFELVGRLDTSTSVELDNKFQEEKIDENIIVLDFKELEYISSAGLRVILKIKKSLDSLNKKLEIHNVNDVVKEVFKVTGFINVLDIK